MLERVADQIATIRSNPQLLYVRMELYARVPLGMETQLLTALDETGEGGAIAYLHWDSMMLASQPFPRIRIYWPDAVSTEALGEEIGHRFGWRPMGKTALAHDRTRDGVVLGAGSLLVLEHLSLIRGMLLAGDFTRGDKNLEKAVSRLAVGIDNYVKYMNKQAMEFTFVA